MSRVRIADLKANLSRHLRSVRNGREITVVDRSTPIARIVPFDDGGTLQVRCATRKPSDIGASPPVQPPTDSLRVLLDDRASR